MSEKGGPSRRVQLAGAAVFAALAAIVSGAISIPYPILPWLTFEFGEIPVVFAFLIFGPLAGVLSTVVLWFILNFTTAWPVVGPLMKLAAVLPMILGLWLGMRLYWRFSSGHSIAKLLGLGLLFGIVIRIAVTSLLNYLLIWFLMPEFLDFGAVFLGYQEPLQGLLLILLVTAIYNALHTILSVAPTFGVARLAPVVKTMSAVGEPWLTRAARR